MPSETPASQEGARIFEVIPQAFCNSRLLKEKRQKFAPGFYGNKKYDYGRRLKKFLFYTIQKLIIDVSSSCLASPLQGGATRHYYYDSLPYSLGRLEDGLAGFQD